MALRRGPGLPRSALHYSQEPSSTESKDEELAQSLIETTPLLFDVVERLEGTRAARRFERIGMVHLLRLQVAIRQLETHFWNNRPSWILDESDAREETELFEKLMMYNKALLEQQKILALPKLAIKEGSASFQGFKDVFKNAGLWESEDFVSLDPCSCAPVCRPKGISRFLYLPIWEDYFKRENHNVPNPLDQMSRTGRKSLRGLLLFAKDCLLGLLLVGFFAVLPAASILVLYVIPTSHKRLWAILGESIFLVCVLTVWNTWSPEKRDILAYMTGIAAVQVIFVGSVIGA